MRSEDGRGQGRRQLVCEPANSTSRLIREVAGERPPGQSGALGDLGDRDVLVAELKEQLNGGSLQPLRSFGVPTGHAVKIPVMSR